MSKYAYNKILRIPSSVIRAGSFNVSALHRNAFSTASSHPDTDTTNAPALSFADDPEKYRIRASYQPFTEKFLKKAKLPKGARILDLASGPGNFGREFAKKGFNVDFIDPMIESDMLEVRKYLAGTQGSGHITAAKGSAHDIPLESGSIDLVISGDAGHWFYYSENVVKELNRVLKPEGKILLVWRQLDAGDQFTRNLHDYLNNQSKGYKSARGRFIMDPSREPKNVAKKFISTTSWDAPEPSVSNRDMTVPEVETLLRTWASLKHYFATASDIELENFREFLKFELHTEKHIHTKWQSFEFYGKPKAVEKSVSFTERVGKRSEEQATTTPKTR